MTFVCRRKTCGRAEWQQSILFEVPISGVHTVTAQAGEYRDEITIKKVAEVNKDYLFVKEGDIVNWFDKEDFRKDCYSIGDTLGEIAKSPEANAIVQRLTDKASASGEMWQRV